MPDKPLVSVVIPTYNRPDQLHRAISSVLSQKGVELDIIIVDDASEIDLSGELAGHPQVTYLRNKKNMGGGFTRNRGIDAARGDFISFLDDDDEFYDGKLQKQVHKFAESNLDSLGIVTCHVRDLRSGNEVIVKNNYKGDIYHKSLERYTAKMTPSFLFKTEAVKNIGGFDTTLPSNQEYDLIIRLSKNYRIDFVDEILAQANRSAGQIHTNFEKKREGALQLFRKFDNEYRRMGWFFYTKMRIKLLLLLFRFWVGKHFGEKAYRMLLKN